jgi:hypothetical protein
MGQFPLFRINRKKDFSGKPDSLPSVLLGRTMLIIMPLNALYIVKNQPSKRQGQMSLVNIYPVLFGIPCNIHNKYNPPLRKMLPFFAPVQLGEGFTGIVPPFPFNGDTG